MGGIYRDWTVTRMFKKFRRGVGWKSCTHSQHTRRSGRVVRNAFFRCKDDEFVDFHRCLNWKIACRARKTIHHTFNRIASSSVCPPSANRAHALPKRIYFVLTAAECNKTRLEKKKIILVHGDSDPLLISATNGPGGYSRKPGSRWVPLGKIVKKK